MLGDQVKSAPKIFGEGSVRIPLSSLGVWRELM